MTAFALIYTAGLAWLAWLAFTAPEGWEDETGWHPGVKSEDD